MSKKNKWEAKQAEKSRKKRTKDTLANKLTKERPTIITAVLLFVCIAWLAYVIIW